MCVNHSAQSQPFPDPVVTCYESVRVNKLATGENGHVTLWSRSDANR